MYRSIPYRGFEIHVTLVASAEDLYDVTFQIKGGQPWRARPSRSPHRDS